MSLFGEPRYDSAQFVIAEATADEATVRMLPEFQSVK
jgi:hypothetical protein